MHLESLANVASLTLRILMIFDKTLWFWLYVNVTWNLVSAVLPFTRDTLFFFSTTFEL